MAYVAMELRQVAFKRKGKVLTGLFYDGHPLMPHMESRVHVDCNVGLEAERCLAYGTISMRAILQGPN